MKTGMYINLRWLLLIGIIAAFAVTAMAAAGDKKAGNKSGKHPPRGIETIDCDTAYIYHYTDPFLTFEMTANGNGVITDTAGFDSTSGPAGHGAYSADYYRDAMYGGSIFTLPNGMQKNGGWFFVVCRDNILDQYDAVFNNLGWLRYPTHYAKVLGHSYEIRFTAAPTDTAWIQFGNTAGVPMQVPFSIWYLNSTPDDPTDDIRMIPVINDQDGDGMFSFNYDHTVSPDSNDPISDWIYFVMPEDMSYGEAGYWAFVRNPYYFIYNSNQEHLARIVLMNWNRHQNETSPGAGDGPISARPDTGTVFRFTFKSADELITTIDTNIYCTPAVDANRWLIDLSRDGEWGTNLNSNTGWGSEFPKYSHHSMFFSGGALIGAKKPVGWPYVVSSIQPSDFGSEFQMGPILNQNLPFDSLIADNPLSASNRVYVIDTSRGGPDWTEWPFDKGAPKDSLNQPLLVSDMDSWCVFNDLDTTKNSDGIGVSPNAGLGLEVQQRTYSYTQNTLNGAQDAVFLRYLVTNKTNVPYDSVYFGIYADPDLGVDYNDLAGTDITRKMVYVYNGDAESYNGHSYSVGIKLLYHSEFGGVETPINASTFYTGGEVASNDLERYHNLMGLKYDGTPRPYGSFDYAGDPIAHTGVCDSSQGDKRIIMSTGPFQLIPGDRVDIIYALLAGDSTNRLLAVKDLRVEADRIQQLFNNYIIHHLDSIDVMVDVPVKNNHPSAFMLYPNYPNPFNPSTKISYQLPVNGKVSLKIYNLLGQEVRTLVKSRQTAGLHEVMWDGKDNTGNAVASGVYLYRLEAGKYVQSRKMLMLK